MIGGRPPHREVTVRLVRTDAFGAPAQEARAREILSGAEVEAMERLRPARARRDYLAAHYLARVLLGELSGVDPALVRLRAAPGGKPEFDPPPGAPPLSFSLSHADGFAVCAAATGCEVGADVEGLRNLGPDPLAVASAVCSAEEVEAMERIPPIARPGRLLMLWTAKEAVAKATGRGLRFPLPLMTVLAERGRAKVEFSSGAGEDAEGWRIAMSRPTPVHAAAVAVHLTPGETASFRILEVPEPGRPWRGGPGGPGGNEGRGRRTAPCARARRARERDARRPRRPAATTCLGIRGHGGGAGI